MSENITWAMLVFTSFFTLINPFGVMPVFMTMTSDLSPEQRKRTALKSNIVAGATLIAFAFTGQLLFNFFGISVDSFRMVGGIIFFLVGFDMLQARFTRTKLDEEEAVKKYVDDISITPLGIPMICGPGAITNAIVLMEDAKTIQQQGIVIGMIAFVITISFFVLWGAGRINNWLGDTGNKIMMRLMGLIVMVIAVEFFFAGLIPKIQPLFQH